MYFANPLALHYIKVPLWFDITIANLLEICNGHQ